MLKKILLFALALSILLAGCLCASADAITVTEIQKYGNLVLSISDADFLALGYEFGDVVTATIGGKAIDMPVGTNYSDVDNGNYVCRVNEEAVILAINMGDLATAGGFAVKTKIEEEPGFRWDYTEGTPQPLEVTFVMKEKGGYYDDYLMHQLTRTNERSDYPHLTDAQYGNFRRVATTGMGQLYCSSSPLNPELKRNGYVDAAMKAAGIKTVVNLADTIEGMQAYEGYADTYYQSCAIIGLNMGVDLAAADFQKELAKGLRFMARQEGPYLVHCNEGKDRSGFAVAVLACLMGASADEVVIDYMTAFEYYYGIVRNGEQYKAIAGSNIEKTLAEAFEIEDIHTADLAEEAERYLAENLALTQEEIAALKANLAR